MAGKLYVLTGPSGVGKTTVATELLKKRPNLKKVVTYTTRPKREGEEDGVDYHFVTEEAFQKMIDDGELFEWARVYDRFYGSRLKDVEELLKENDVLFVIDVQGASQIKQSNTDAIILAIEPESPEVLLARLEKRDKGETVNMKERQEALTKELEFCKACLHRIVNKEGLLDNTVAEIEEIMDKA